ncbi:MAG: hypothetical protein JAZ15_03375 [Candidatus Thiodiazotropha endolucinida]|nr:hypothetical protein [Candidatus Thiodiazotropha taylori]MCW4312035.1 hypothetical protein [Candidatus Thiodiazotropha taylori]
MNIISVISYKNGWERIAGGKELNDLVSAFSEFTNIRKEEKRNNSSSIWAELLEPKGWQEISGIESAGVAKNGIVSRLVDGNREFIYEWIYSYSRAAYFSDEKRVPVLLVRMRESSSRKMVPWTTFEDIYKKCFQLSPMSAEHPFVILGLNAGCFDFGDPCVFHLDSFSGGPISNSSVINIFNNREVAIPRELFEPMMLFVACFGRFLKKRHQNPGTIFNLDMEEKLLRVTLTTRLDDYESVRNTISDYVDYFRNENVVLNHLSSEYIELLKQKNLIKTLLENAKIELASVKNQYAKANSIYLHFTSLMTNALCTEEVFSVLGKDKINELKLDFIDLVNSFDETVDEDFKFNVQSILRILENERLFESEVSRVGAFKKSIIEFVDASIQTVEKGGKLMSNTTKLLVNLKKIKEVLKVDDGGGDD